MVASSFDPPTNKEYSSNIFLLLSEEDYRNAQENTKSWQDIILARECPREHRVMPGESSGEIRASPVGSGEEGVAAGGRGVDGDYNKFINLLSKG